MRRRRAKKLAILCSPGIPELSGDWRRCLERLAAAAETAHSLGGQVHLVLADDEHLRQLNAAYRGKDRATDVLSFDLGAGPEAAVPGGPRLRGEIYISLERARDQAVRQRVPLLAELTRLLAHGLLHLAGYDHDTPAALRFMERETERLLAELALPLDCPAAVFPERTS